MNDVEIVVFNDKSWVRLAEYQELKEENKQLGNEYNSLVIDHERLDYLYGQQIDDINDLFKKNEQLKQQTEKMKCCGNCIHRNTDEAVETCRKLKKYTLIKGSCECWELAE